VRDGAWTATFAEHGERVLRLADALRTTLGLTPADRFGMLALNGHRFMELYHAAFLGTAIVNPLNPRFSAEELAFVLEDSDTRIVFADEPLVGLLDVAVRRLGLRVVVLDARPGGYEELLAGGRPIVPPEPEEDAPVLLMYTGGTTGRPKGVVLTQRAQALNALHLEVAIGYPEQTVHLHQAPMFHAAAMPPILTVPANGGMSTFLARFEPGALLAAVEREGVTQTTMVPTMIAMLLRDPAYRPERLATLRSLIYGASPMPESLLRELMADLPGLELSHGYGMTEASTGVSVLTAADHRAGGARLRSVGRPLAGVEVSVRDGDGERVPAGTPGEIWARGGNFLERYWRRPEESAAVLVDGWYRTGDAGYVDADGYLFVVDRLKDMIITGGENVYSVEVEAALASHGGVAQAAVIGIPHETWGEQVHAIVVPRPGTTVEVSELQQHCRALIAAYKVPKSFELRDEPLPLSGAMKVLKPELRAPYWTSS
jgi:long-chain acyl-CoA synthetase